MITVISASWGLVQRDSIIGLAKYKHLMNFGFASALRNAITLQILYKCYNSQGIAIIRTSYLKPSYFSGTLILANLARGHVIAKFNMH